ncbi:hypothetical protein [uncultured Muribaculum sp.]|uniref:hypothetical protein n=1 Tax=uncultured Muribaculum sp. TaxID=1918613 RepID=UPI0025B73D54|nr:hypothetical protein [uncultured Muribaculum sp.]
MVSKGTIFFFDKQIFRVRVYIKEIQARARAGLCTWRYWVVMCVVEFLVLLIFFVVVTFGFAGCCAPGIGFSQKSCKNIWKLRRRFVTLHSLLRRKPGSGPGPTPASQLFQQFFFAEKFGGKEKIRNFARLFRGTDPESGKRTLTNIAIDKEVVQDKSGCGHAPQPESPVIS